MEFIKDIFNHTEPYDFYLVNPEGKAICALNSIDTSTTSLTATLNDRWELSFSVEKYIDVNNDANFVLSNGYGYLEKGMEVCIDGIGYFVITEVPSVQFDGYSEMKTIKAESCDVELENKDLISFYINTGKTGSKEYTADGNVIEDKLTGNKILKRYVALYDPDNRQLSLLDLVLEKLPGWSVGHVDESYIDEEGNTKWLIPYKRQNENGEDEWFFVRGTFEEESINVYAFLTQKVAQAYRCVFTFDILNRKINCYHISQLGKDTGISLSTTNYIDSLSVTGATNDVYTQFNVAGGENLDIKYVNFGEITIDNLSYVLKEPLVSKDLIDKYEAYLKYRGTHWDSTKNEKVTYTLDDETTKGMTRREYYSYLTRMWGKYKKIADEIKNRVPNDGLQTDWDTFKEDELQKQLEIYIDAVNFILKEYGYAKRDADGKPIKKEDGTYETILTGDDLKAQMIKDMCWYSYTAYVDNVIPNIKIAIANIPKQDDDKVKPIDKWETTWELFGVDELKVRIKMYQNSIDTLVKEGYDKPYDVSDNKTDYYKEYTDYVQKRDAAQAALEERENEYKTASDKVQEWLDKRTEVYDDCSLKKNKNFGFIDDDGNLNSDGIAIFKLYMTTDYTNENYLITTLDDIETYVDRAEELYQAAVKELSSQSQPQYIYSPQIENLLCDEDFSPYLNQLVLGDYIWLEIDDGNEFGGHGKLEKFRLYTFSFNPKDPSEKFEISFTNMIKSQSKRDDEVFLLNSSTKTNRNSITSATYTGVDESINAILTPELLKAITGQLTTSVGFGNAVGNMVEYINSQPNSVLNITANQTNVKKIVGTEAEFEKFFSKYIDADYINARVVIANVGEFKNLTTEVANIKSAIIGTSSTETGIVFNLSSANAKFDSAWIINGIAGKMTIGDLAAGDITISDTMRILSENGNFIMNGSAMQFLDTEGNVGIQIGYDTNKNPSIIIKDNKGVTVMTSQGITKDAIADGLIVNNMLGDQSISKDKLNFPIVEANEQGGINIEQIYDGKGGLWGVEYTETMTSINSSLDQLTEDIANLNTAIDSVSLTGQQVFTETDTGISPTSITLTATVNNGAEISKWYVDGTENTSYVSSDKLQITIPSSYMTNRKTVVIKVECTDTSKYDVMTLYKVTDGASAYTVVANSSNGTTFEYNNTIYTETICTCKVLKGSKEVTAKSYVWYKQSNGSTQWKQIGTGARLTVSLKDKQNQKIKCSVEI